MKKIFFAVPVLALTVLFTFCHKTTVQEETSAGNNAVAVSDRGTCNVFISADNISNTMRICGLPLGMSTMLCKTCTGNSSTGITFNGTATLASLPTPITFSIINPGLIDTWVTVTSANADGPVLIPANGGCVDFTVSDPCVVSH